MGKKVAGTYHLPYTITAEWTAYLIFSIIFVPILVIVAFSLLNDPSAWQVALIPLAIFGIITFWLNSLKIQILDAKLTYKTLFGGTKSISYSKIKRLALNVGVPTGGKKGGYYALEFYGDIPDEVELAINIKPFGKRDIAVLVDALSNKAPSAKIDKTLTELKDGDFNVVISQGIKKSWQIFLLLLFMAVLALILKSLLSMMF